MKSQMIRNWRRLVPVYEYKCDSCATHFELRCSFSGQTESPCPKCRGKAHRVFLPVSVIFKGSGFYIADNRGKESGSAS